MAGGRGDKVASKILKLANGQPSIERSENLKDSSTGSAPQKTTFKLSLSGILGLNQPAEISKSANTLHKGGEHLFSSINHLDQEQQILLDNRQKELEKKIVELQDEIKKLINATDNLEKSVEVSAKQEVIEASEYQISFFNRIKNFIAEFRKNISEACLWLDAFSNKKKKKNYFWNMVKNKKKGGDQFLMSNESSSARAAG
jgi:uncharacterized protein YjgD (DUF1641 family)